MTSEQIEESLKRPCTRCINGVAIESNLVLITYAMEPTTICIQCAGTTSREIAAAHTSSIEYQRAKHKADILWQQGIKPPYELKYDR